MYIGFIFNFIVFVYMSRQTENENYIYWYILLCVWSNLGTAKLVYTDIEKGQPLYLYVSDLNHFFLHIKHFNPRKLVVLRSFWN